MLDSPPVYFIDRGVLHGGEVLAGTRTIRACGGHRAGRACPLKNASPQSNRRAVSELDQSVRRAGREEERQRPLPPA